MSKFPSLPLFTDAFLADTTHLGPLETGAYLLLIMIAWRTPACALPDDDVKLAKWARCDPRTWRKIKPAIMEFWTLNDGIWRQKRLTKEREIVSKRAEVARVNGTTGGRPKALKDNKTDNPSGLPQVTHTKAPNPNPNPIEDSEAKASALSGASPRPIYTDSTHELWVEGVAILVQLGTKERVARSNIGRWLRDTRDPVAVLGAIQRARDHGSGDAIAFVTAALRTFHVNGSHGLRTNSAPGSRDTGSDAILAGVARAAERRARERGAAGQGERPAPGDSDPPESDDARLL